MTFVRVIEVDGKRQICIRDKVYIYVRRKVRIRTILGFSCGSKLCCANPRNVLRKPRPRVAVFYVFSTLPASGRFASEGSFV